jgi:proline dehydrogenase
VALDRALRRAVALNTRAANGALVRLLPTLPRAVVRRVAARYIAGPHLDDAVTVVRELNAQEKLATIDVLGEEIRDADAAAGIVKAYEDVFDEIDQLQLRSNVSIKLTGLGLKLDYDLCYANLEHVATHARAGGNFVRIDMEDSSTTDDTLLLYRALRNEGFDNLGVVLQASLRRTLTDVRELADLKPSVRICKGIYVEPAEIQFKDDDQVRANFVQALDDLLENGSYVAIATHDEWLVERALERIAQLSRREYEFQMLLGVRPELGERLVADGHRVRIYVPFGEHWYEYSLRRLQENPTIAGAVARDTIARVVRR